MSRFSLRSLLALLFICLSLTACDSREEKETKYINRGNALFEQSEYKKAALEYKNAARINPSSPEVRYRLGLVSEAQKDLRNAFMSFLAAEQQDPHFIPALLKLSEYYLAAEQSEQVQKRLNTIFAIDPSNAQAHALRAALLLRDKNFVDSEKESNLALAKDSANVMAFSTLAKNYELQDQKEKAEKIIEEAIAKNPKELSLLILKTLFYAHENNLEKLAESYQAIFKLSPDAIGFRNDLAHIYAKVGRSEDGEKVLREGISARPENENMKHALVDFLNETKGLDAAESEILKAQQADPKNNTFAFWLVDLYIKHDEPDRAMAVLKALITKDQANETDLTTAQTSLARIHYLKGEKQDVKTLIDAVLEKKPDNADALLMRAHLAFERGDYENAVTDLRLIVRDNPRAINAQDLLAETLQAQGRIDLAIDTLNQLISLDPSNVKAQVRLAQLYNMHGESKRALDLMRLITESRPDFAIGWESLARIALDAKEWDTAAKAIDKLAAIKGQDLTATFLKARTASLKERPEEALALYKKVVLADPSAPMAEYALAALCEAARTPDQLKNVIAFMGTLQPQTAYSLTLLGETNLTLRHLDEAASWFDQAIAKAPAFQSPYISRARLFMAKNQSEEALAVLRKAVEQQPSDLRAPMMIADILGSQKKYDESIKGYEDILKRNPKADIAANNMAQLIADAQTDDSSAMEKARVAAERFISSTNPLFLDTLAWVYFRQDNLTQAQAVMDRVMTFGDKLPAQIHYHNGAILLKIGKTAEAKAELQKALADKKDYSGRGEAETLLKGL